MFLILSKVNYVLRFSKKNVNYETFEQFYASVKHLLENTRTKYIDKTIEWMSKRMLMVIKSKGQG